MKNSYRLAAFAPIAILSLLTFSLLGVSDAQAQSYAQGVASVQMKRKCKDDMPRKREDYNAALSSAKVNSIRSWTAQKSTAFAELYQNSEQEIIGQIDTYLTVIKFPGGSLRPLACRGCWEETGGPTVPSPFP